MLLNSTVNDSELQRVIIPNSSPQVMDIKEKTEVDGNDNNDNDKKED